MTQIIDIHVSGTIGEVREALAQLVVLEEDECVFKAVTGEDKCKFEAEGEHVAGPPRYDNEVAKPVTPHRTIFRVGDIVRVKDLVDGQSGLTGRYGIVRKEQKTGYELGVEFFDWKAGHDLDGYVISKGSCSGRWAYGEDFELVTKGSIGA